MTKLKRWKMASLVVVLCSAAAVSSTAQTYEKLVDFIGSNGANPEYMSLVQGIDGQLYGTTAAGGMNGGGAVFKTTVNGVVTRLHSFNGNYGTAGGYMPLGGLVLATDGNFYGTTSTGGSGDGGTVFRITPTGTITFLYNFCSVANCADGGHPRAAMIQGSDGNLYGTTAEGGANCAPVGGCGTIFQLTLTGTFTTIYDFCSLPGCVDGSTPEGGLLQGIYGTFYGTTSLGGSSGNCLGGCGTVFAMTPSGTLATLHSFDYNDGTEPTATLTQANDLSLYGTTTLLNGYGSDNCGQCGTAFKITPQGTLTTLFQASNSTDIYLPYSGVIQGTDGNFYGTANAEGNGVEGSIFSFVPGGVFTTLYTFCEKGGCTVTGGKPLGGLVQDTNGRFYGTTYEGGGDNFGVVFSLDMNLSPFVTFLRSAAPVSGTATILGQGFTGTSSVSFNGTPASFVINASTYLTATVPAGATTGPVTVTAPGGTLTSNVPFHVTPQVLSFDPPNGPVGTQVTITGVSLTQSLGLGFGNYSPAKFKVDSDTQVTATVPTGAQTGPIGIETKGGIAISTAKFTVTH